MIKYSCTWKTLIAMFTNAPTLRNNIHGYQNCAVYRYTYSVHKLTRNNPNHAQLCFCDHGYIVLPNLLALVTDQPCLFLVIIVT